MTQDNFTAYLFDSIADEYDMDIPGFSENPICNKSPSALRNLFTGVSTLAPKDASWLLCHLNKEKFITIMKQLPLDTMVLIAQELQQRGHALIPVYKVEEYMADLFVKYIRARLIEDRSSSGWSDNSDFRPGIFINPRSD